MVQGIPELEHKWGKIPVRVLDEVRLEMERIAEDVVRTARQLAPKDQGDLVRSISWTFGDVPPGAVVLAEGGDRRSGLVCTIYAGDQTTLVTNKRGQWFQNARIQEFGTRDRPHGHPFFFPAWRLWRRRVRLRLNRAIREAIRKAG